MKAQILYFSLIFNSLFADAAVQTASNQDKPPYIYIKNSTQNTMSISSRSDNIDWTMPSGITEDFTYNVGSSWNSSSGGSYSRTTEDTMAYYYFSPTYKTENDWIINGNWPSGTETEQNITSDNSGGSSTSTTTLNNVPPPITYEQCDGAFALGNTYLETYYGAQDIVSISTMTIQSMQTQVVLKTGGKATSKLRNLIALSVTARQGMPPKDNLGACPTMFDDQSGPDYMSYGYAYDFGANVPPQSIQLGSYGMVSGNGGKYVVVPDNADVDITPYVSGMDDYTFNVGSPIKYHSYFSLFVEQANPGYSLIPINYHTPSDAGHVSWGLSTDAPQDAAKQYMSSGLTNYLGAWGFGPGASGSLCSSDPGQVQPNNPSFGNIVRTFYIGFPDLLSALLYVKQTHDSPPAYCFSGINCVAVAVYTGHQAGVHALPEDQSAQNFGVDLIMAYPSPTITPNPFVDTTDTFYSRY